MKLQLCILVLLSLLENSVVQSQIVAGTRSLPPVLSGFPFQTPQYSPYQSGVQYGGYGSHSSGSNMFNLFEQLQHGHDKTLENEVLNAAILRQINLVIPSNIKNFNKAGRANIKKQKEILKQLMKIIDVTAQKMTQDLEHMHAYQPPHGPNNQFPYGYTPYNPYSYNPFRRFPYY